MELGNLLFGNSRGEYEFPDRDIVDSDEWIALRNILGIDSDGVANKDNPHANKRGGYDDGEICVNPYYWGEDGEEADEPNFLDRRIGLEIRWYKYPFRDSYMNWQMDAPALRHYFGGLAIYLAAKKEKDAWTKRVEELRARIDRIHRALTK